jgi:hypothetical protein
MTRNRRIFRSNGARSALAFTSLIAAAASCSSEEVKPRGQLMLAISTDLYITKDMNQVGVEVFGTDGSVISARDLDIIPAGDTPMPGTLAVVPPDAGGQIVRVKVTAKHQAGANQEPRVVRQAIVKVPTDRVAMLTMPLHWLCDVDSSDAVCSDAETCKAGVCVPADVDADALPDYSPALVFGGGDEQGRGSECLDVKHCFESAEVLKKPTVDDCSLPVPDGAREASLNVAMVLPPGTDGHCLDDPTTGEKGKGTCFMPFDRDPDDGFTIEKGRIKMPAAACKRKGVTGIAISTICDAKDLSMPICGRWNGWHAGPSGEGGEGGVGGAAQLPVGGDSSVPVGGQSSAGEGGVSIGGTSPGKSCPVTAELAPAYYYLLLDATGEMQSLPTIRQAVQQFVSTPASSGVRFGLQVIEPDPQCDAPYDQPLIDFTPLPGVQLPNLQPGNGYDMFLDSALGQTFGTLNGITEPASKTLVVITGGVDQSCNNDPDQFHQTLSDALNAGVLVRTVLVRGQDQPTPEIMSGLQATGYPQPTQFTGQSLQAGQLATTLGQFRDALGPCTYLAPSALRYSVQLASADSGQPQTLALVRSSTACIDQPSYYRQGRTIVLCPSTCDSKGSAELQTDECSIGGSATGTAGSSSVGGATGAGGASAGGASAGGASSGGAGSGRGGVGGATGTGGAPAPGTCPPVQPTNNTACTPSGLICDYKPIQCTCKGVAWTCQ